MFKGPDIRRMAMDIVRRVSFDGVYFDLALETVTSDVRINPRARALLYEISAGTVRHTNTLDMLVRRFATRPIEGIEPDVLAALRIGIYQLVYLSRVPPHAAVHETVRAVKSACPGAAGFVNAVLRSVAGIIDCRIETSTPFGEPGTLLPVLDGWCRFTEKIFPDQKSDFEGFLEKCLSFPPELVRRLVGAFGNGWAMQVCFALNVAAPVYIRTNVGRIGRDELLREFRRARVEAEKGKIEPSVKIGRRQNVRKLPGYAEGWFNVQDETAQKTGLAVRVPDVGTILDLCAAPGGKTTHMAELNPGVTVYAVDVDDARLDRLRENVGRLGLRNVKVVCADARHAAEAAPGPHDAVVIDAPCTNTGVYRRRPDARWRYSEAKLASLVELQDVMLEAAAPLVKRGGTLVYSTCSILMEEDEERTHAFAERHPEYDIEKEERSNPITGGPDGGYYAVIRRGQQ